MNRSGPHASPFTDDVYLEFAVTYLTETVDLSAAAAVSGRPAKIRGLVKYNVYAKNAEDAIRRLRQREPAEHPIVEIASVGGTGDDSTMLVLPIEWGLVGTGAKERGGEN